MKLTITTTAIDKSIEYRLDSCSIRILKEKNIDVDKLQAGVTIEFLDKVTFDNLYGDIEKRGIPESLTLLSAEQLKELGFTEIVYSNKHRVIL